MLIVDCVLLRVVGISSNISSFLLYQRIIKLSNSVFPNLMTSNEYHASRYIQVRAADPGTAALNLELIRTLHDIDATGLVFSLDETLTSALATAVEVGTLEKEHLGIVIGYGSGSEMEHYVEKDIVDELIVSDVLYSSKIGLRYLNDILRGFYVPPTLDSGVKLIT